jgi:hypothetical protein
VTKLDEHFPFGDNLLLAVFYYYKSSPLCSATLSHYYGYALILAKIGLGYIWMIFSQTHLVTMPETPPLTLEIPFKS